MGTPASIEKRGRPVVLFDGVCNLCNGAVQFIINRDPAGKFLFAALQSSAAKQLLGERENSKDDPYSIILIEDGKLYDRSDALIEIAKHLPGGWSLLAGFRFLPKFFRDALYKLVANNRYRFFGRQDSCMMPTPELKARFLDN
jgi:predicted DCC family thiol-disulfide oxidoreductase YuxK